MDEIAKTIGFAILLSSIPAGLLSVIATIIRQHKPEANLWFFDLIAIPLGAAIGWYAKANLFIGSIDDVLVARILTSAIIAGGPVLINYVFSNAPTGSVAELLTRSSQVLANGRRIRGW